MINNLIRIIFDIYNIIISIILKTNSANFKETTGIGHSHLIFFFIILNILMYIYKKLKEKLKKLIYYLFNFIYIIVIMCILFYILIYIYDLLIIYLNLDMDLRPHINWRSRICHKNNCNIIVILFFGVIIRTTYIVDVWIPAMIEKFTRPIFDFLNNYNIDLFELDLDDLGLVFLHR
jgi:hypothetical protein